MPLLAVLVVVISAVVTFTSSSSPASSQTSNNVLAASVNERALRVQTAPRNPTKNHKQLPNDPKRPNGTQTRAPDSTRYLGSFAYSIPPSSPAYSQMWTADDWITKDPTSGKEVPWQNIILVSGNDTAFCELSREAASPNPTVNHNPDVHHNPIRRCCNGLEQTCQCSSTSKGGVLTRMKLQTR